MKKLKFSVIILMIFINYQVNSLNFNELEEVLRAKSNNDEILKNLFDQIAMDRALKQPPKLLEQAPPPPHHMLDKDPDFDFDQYYDYNIIVHYLNRLFLNYTSILTLERIGVTYNSEPIVIVKISNKKYGNPAIWLDGGIHGNEWISSTSVLYIINEFVKNYNKLPEFIKNIDWYFVPMLNPDGYVYTRQTHHVTRKNRRISTLCNEYHEGVDLYRNFGSIANREAAINPCLEGYSGPSPFSEPESKSVHDFIIKQQNRIKWTVYLTFHSFGQFILYPTNLRFENQELRIIGEQLANAIKKYNNATYLVRPTTDVGGSEHWAFNSKIFKLAYKIQLRDTGKYGYYLPKNQIKPTGKDALILVETLAKIITKK